MPLDKTTMAAAQHVPPPTVVCLNACNSPTWDTALVGRDLRLPRAAAIMAVALLWTRPAHGCVGQQHSTPSPFESQQEI
jgi:hypothetical protein